MTCLRYSANKLISPTAILLMAAAFSIPQGTFAQDRDYDHSDYDQIRRLDLGRTIRVRADETIDSREGDSNFRGYITDDIRGDNGLLVIPAGSPVELGVRVMPYYDLRLELRSINIRGQQYGVDSDPMHVEAQQPAGVAGGVIGALNNGEIGGSEVHIPRDSILTFYLESPLVVGPPNK